MKMSFEQRMRLNFYPALKHLIGKPAVYLEIGVFAGTTAEWVLNNILTHEDSELIGIDPWERALFSKRDIRNDKEWEALNEKLEELAENPRVNWIRGYSWDVIPLQDFKPESIDAVYIDGEHSFDAVIRDFGLVWPLVKKCGVIIFDDYDSKDPGSPEVKIAVDGILGALKDKINIIFINRQVGIIKL